MSTILEIIRRTTATFEAAGVASARLLAEEALAVVLGISRMELYLQFDKPLNERELSSCSDVVARLSQGEPLAYLEGEIEFFGCRLHVTRDVLVPRPETEVLVDRIVCELQKTPLAKPVVWDICCGSGCIGIALKKRFPKLHVVLSDISEAALSIAKENADRNSVAVEFRSGDLLAPFQHEKADIVVSNPPYLAESEFAGSFEPKIALVAGPSGLEYYERFASELPPLLEEGARLFFEIGYSQGQSVLALFSGSPWKEPSVVKDWAGKDRFFSVAYEPIRMYQTC